MSLRNAFFGMALAAIILPSPSAHARPVDLTCRQDNSSHDSREGHITFDKREGTAGFAITGEMPASPAEFTDDEITWDTKYVLGRVYFTLNRKTGELQVTGATTGNWHCTH
jgi:hypothetical protein